MVLRLSKPAAQWAMPPAKGPQHMKRRISGKHRAVEPAKKKYKKPSSVKNQLRSMERMLKVTTPPSHC